MKVTRQEEGPLKPFNVTVRLKDKTSDGAKDQAQRIGLEVVTVHEFVRHSPLGHTHHRETDYYEGFCKFADASPEQIIEFGIVVVYPFSTADPSSRELWIVDGTEGINALRNYYHNSRKIEGDQIEIEHFINTI